MTYNGITRRLDQLTSITFLPWVGDNYGTGLFRLRLLIVGDSFYDWSDDAEIGRQRDLASDIIREQLRGDYSVAFHTKLCSAFLGYSPSLADKQAFWQSVAFYNFLQVSAGSHHAADPGQDAWLASRRPFLEVLEALQPQAVVALGERVWNWMPEAMGPPPQVPGVERRDLCRYQHSGGGVAVMRIAHPSYSGFQSELWTPLLRSFLDAARKA